MDKSGLRRRGQRQGDGHALVASSPFASPMKPVFGSPSLKGHHGGHYGAGAAAADHANRLPFCDLTNGEPEGGCGEHDSINAHMASNWNFVKKNKAGELGMETFKKFLEKKKGVSTEAAPAGQAGRDLAPPPQQATARAPDVAMAHVLGSPDHRVQTQNAESAKSPWSYQLQVSPFPLSLSPLPLSQRLLQKVTRRKPKERAK